MQRDGLDERFDPYFHQPRFRRLSETLISIGSAPLGSLVDYADEEWDKSDGRFPDTFPYIEIGNVELGANEYAIERVDVGNAPSRARQVVRENDVLVSLTRPHRGAIARVLPEHDGAIASTGFAVIRGADNQRALMGYIMACLTASFGRDQMLRRSSGGTYPAITRDQLARVLIPNLEIDEQRRLADDMADARAERKAKLAEADALLAGLDDFVLSELGIDPPQEDNRRVFAVRLGDIGGRSMSPAHHTPVLHRFIDALRKHPAADKPLSAYVEINPSDGVAGLAPDAMVGFIPMQAIADGATGEHTVAERPLREVSKGYTQFADGDILWAKMTPCLENGKVCIVDNLPNGIGFGSTEFHVLRAPRNGVVLAEFVREFISQASLRRTAARASSGSAQQRIPAAFLASLRFPAVPLERQREIVASVRATRERARRLRAEAEAGWAAARAGFEVAVVG